jgi:hypothetical protein
LKWGDTAHVIHVEYAPITAPATDTGGMQNRTLTNRIIVLGTSLVAGIVVAAMASAGGHHCGRCGGTAAGTTYPCRDAGCGPRYCGPEHWQDPCDGCGRWIGCDGSRQGTDMLAPWQLPPGRGFTKPSDLGYERPIGVCGEGGPCSECEACEPPHHAWGWRRPWGSF